MAELTDLQIFELLQVVFNGAYLTMARRLDRIEEDLHRVIAVQQQQGEFNMAFAQDVQQLISAINTETDQIAARIDGLIQRLNSNPSPEEQASITTSLSQISSRLSALGADPNNPIPAAA